MSTAGVSGAHRSLLIGGSAGVGRALAERLATRGHDLLLVARGERDLEAVAGDLRLRGRCRVESLALDLADPGNEPSTLVGDCITRLGGLDHVFFTIGEIHPEDRAPGDPRLVERLTRTNYLAPAGLLVSLGRYFKESGTGDIVVASSIAAAVPRAKNQVYAAAKVALERYCLSLRHYLSDTRVCVRVCRLGYVDTTMSYGLPLRLPVASPEAVGLHLAEGLGKKSGLTYYPRFWAVLVRALKCMPWFVYRRLAF